MTVQPRQNITRAAEGLDRRRFTVSDVEAMVAAGILDEDERVELVGGELVPMSPKGLSHETLKAELVNRWYRLPLEAVTLAVATTLRLSDDSYLEPDIVVFECADGLSAAFEKLSGPSVLLVVEIADSSLHFDLGFKAAVYASFGVRELWVIDAVKLSIRVFRDPAADGYRQVEDVAASAVVAPRLAPSAFALRLADLMV